MAQKKSYGCLIFMAALTIVACTIATLIASGNIKP